MSHISSSNVRPLCGSPCLHCSSPGAQAQGHKHINTEVGFKPIMDTATTQKWDTNTLWTPRAHVASTWAQVCESLSSSLPPGQ